MASNSKDQPQAQSQFRSDIKIIVVGMAGTGKTSYVQKWTKDIFSEAYKATIVSEFGFKVYQHKGKMYRVQVWDIAGKQASHVTSFTGQDKNVSITKIFTKGALGYVVCSDSTDKTTLEDAIRWKKTIDDVARFPDGKNLSSILIENKGDLLPEEQMKDDASLKEFGKKNNFEEAFRTSAKVGININESMDYLIDTILSRMEAFSNQSNQQGKEIFKSERNIVELDPRLATKDPKIKPKTDNCC